MTCKAIGYLAYALMIFLAAALEGHAQLAGRVATDLAPLDAKIALVRDDEIFLNKGDTAGVHGGDLFTVFRTGPRLDDPDTGENLGNLNDPVALIQVKRLRSRHCICTAVLQLGTLSEGMTAKRFQDIPTLMVLLEPTDSAHRLKNLLTVKLHHLDWMPSQPSDRRLMTQWDAEMLRKRGIGMVFVLSRNALTLYGRQGRPVRNWLLDIRDLEPGMVRSGPPPPAAPATVNPTVSGPPAVDVQRVLRIDGLLLSMDVLDLDGSGIPDAVYLTPEGVGFCPDLDWGRRVFYRHRGFGKPIGISVSADGLMAVNVYTPNRRMNSLLLRLDGNRFAVVADNINYLLGFFDIGSGRKDTLLGQSFDGEQIFGARVVGFEKGETAFSSARRIPVPRNFRITSAALFRPDSGGGYDSAFINSHHKLVIHQRGKTPWISARDVGGSVMPVTIQEGTEKIGFSRTIHIDPPPLLLSAGAHEDAELLVVANNGLTDSIVDGFGRFEFGQILHVRPSDLGRTMRPVCEPLEGAVQGLAVFKKTIYCGLVKGSMISGPVESYIVAVPFPGTGPIEAAKAGQGLRF